ncbi:STAS domain-containing protein [Kovacikia minuta CCNUW1]|uniref:STAS domain-containing protein n=1 Tax=Kovacikia minuta TaxID=2931930 RepID=UPI001CCF67E8|nr:STAS domain-containing protein [Kovacikia minuta]UBF24226.1 STAS domain-containing protein [Kovacikia minuta CCNUW1]
MSTNPVQVSSIQVLKPIGVLTGTTSHQLLQQFKECLDVATDKIVLIDLQGVDFIDSCGLGTLVSLHTRLKLAGGKLYLCSPKEQARTLFDVSDMDRIFEIFSSREAFDAKISKRNLAVLVE